MNEMRALSWVWMAAATAEEEGDKEEEEVEEVTGMDARERAGGAGETKGQPEKLRDGEGEGNMADVAERRRKGGVMMRWLLGEHAGMSNCQSSASCET
jgi:hypothetical protein